MKRILRSTVVLLALGCGTPSPPPPSGGVTLPARVGECPRGFGVVSSDYASSSVAVLSQDGIVLSGSMMSSASAVAGTSAALSGDVVLGREPPSGDAMVVVDRYPNAVLTRLALATASASAQRSVATGFASNPHDFVTLGDGRAYVARYGTNPKPGREALDGGSDLLVVDATSLAVQGRVDLAAAGDGLPARPDRFLRLGDLVLVLLGRIDPSFKTAADGRIAAVDPKTDSVAWTTDLPGLTNCGAFSLSQDGTRLAATCSGVFAAGPTQLDGSDVVVLDATKRPLVVESRLAIAKPLGAALAPAIAWDEDRVVGVAYGDQGAGRPDVVWLSRGGAAPVVVAKAGKAFVFGDLVCSACSKVCLFTDAERGTVRRLRWNGAGYDELPETKIEGAAGLPPRTFGSL